MKSKRSAAIGIAVYGLSLACLGALFLLAGKESLARLLKPDWPYLATAIILSLISIEIMTRRFELALRFVQVEHSVSHKSLYYGTAFGLTGGLFLTDAAGQVLARSALLKGHEGMNLTSGIFSSSIEKLIDLLTCLVLSLPLVIGMVFPGRAISSFLYLVLYGSFGLLWIFAAGLWMPAILRFVRSAVRFLVRHLPWLGRVGKKQGVSWVDTIIPREVTSLEGGSEPVKIMALTLIKSILLSARYYVICLAFGIDIPFQIFLLGAPLVQISTVFSFTPGSLGILDAGWIAVLSLANVPHATSLQFLALLRITSYLIYPLIVLSLKPLMRFGKS